MPLSVVLIALTSNKASALPAPDKETISIVLSGLFLLIFLTPQKGSVMSAAVDESTYSDPGTSGTTFRYDPTAQQYVYNWSTKGLQAGYWYKLSAKLDDGTIRSVVVGIR